MWVPPFRHPRIVGYLPLPAAFRSLSRLSSALSAKASALCPFLLDLFGHPCPPGRIALHPGFCMVPHAWYVPIPFFWLFDVFLRISGCFPPTSFPCVNFSRYNPKPTGNARHSPGSTPCLAYPWLEQGNFHKANTWQPSILMSIPILKWRRRDSNS